MPSPLLLALAFGMAGLGWAYWPNLQYLYTIWNNEPNYSHGILVIPIALVIFWQRLADVKVGWNVSQGPWWSWVVLAAIVAARAFAYERGSQWLETATVVPAVAILMFTLGGWRLLERGWPAVVFLLFMLNLPKAIDDMVAMPLQRIATMGSVFVMQLTGLWVVTEGNIIVLTTPQPPPNDHKLLEVALACNGLSMLMTLAATVTATIALIPLANWKRIVVLASAIPIALLSNIIRIVATGWFYYYVEGEKAKQRAHDWSGYLMMPLALLLVGIELMILSWLAADSGEDDQDDAPRVDPVLARLGAADAPRADPVLARLGAVKDKDVDPVLARLGAVKDKAKEKAKADFPTDEL
jgi:exosortase